jgi:hypothetical protein
VEDRLQKKVQNYYYPPLCVYQLMEEGGVMSEAGEGGDHCPICLHIFKNFLCLHMTDELVNSGDTMVRVKNP